jgi:hypothetical protein
MARKYVIVLQTDDKQTKKADNEQIINRLFQTNYKQIINRSNKQMTYRGLKQFPKYLFGVSSVDKVEIVLEIEGGSTKNARETERVTQIFYQRWCTSGNRFNE